MNNLFKNVFKGKKVLITGHTGFKGSWLSIWLTKLGAEVVGYALEPYTNKDNFELSNLKNKIIDIRGDIRDFESLKKVFDEYKPEFVFHLAAQSLVRLSYENPKDTYDINIGGTVNVLECIKNTESIRVGIMVTTDKCYDNKEWVWGYRENDELGGYDPYSSSKGAAEIVIAGYRNSFFNTKNYKEHKKAISSVRAGNIIGGGDWSKDRIVPDCIRALENKADIEIRNPTATRPWQHVLEPIYGYLLLASKMYNNGEDFSSAWNFGPDSESIVQVKEVSSMIIEYWGEGKWKDASNSESVHEAKLLSLDCNKAKKYLGWKPRLDIKKALKLTVQWYKNYGKADVYNMCIEQIKEYLGEN